MPMTHTCRYYTYRPHTLGTWTNSTHALWPHHWRCGSANFSSKSLGRCPLRTTCNHTTTGLTELTVKSPCCPNDVLPRGSSPDPERNQHCKIAFVLLIRPGSTPHFLLNPLQSKGGRGRREGRGSGLNSAMASVISRAFSPSHWTLGPSRNTVGLGLGRGWR